MMGARRKVLGFQVFERCEDFEQALGLFESEHLPPGGVLSWVDDSKPRVVFTTRKLAREAIERSEHLRLAWKDGKDGCPGVGQIPERQFCVIVPVTFNEDQKGAKS
jgi:hypothetical protein